MIQEDGHGIRPWRLMGAGLCGLGRVGDVNDMQDVIGENISIASDHCYSGVAVAGRGNPTYLDRSGRISKVEDANAEVTLADIGIVAG